MQISVFQYQSARTYLKDQVTLQKKTDPSFSVRRFARHSEVGSHALLVMLLNGKRRMTLKQAPAFAKAFQMSSLEHMYFKMLIQLDNATSEEERDLCKLWLNDLNPSPEHKMVEVEHFHLISNWVHMAIITLAKIPGVQLTADSIHGLLGQKVSLPECRQALERLIELELLIQKDGQWIPAQTWVRTKDDVANRGAREYHKQVGQLGIQAIEGQSVDEREFQGFALTVPKDKIHLAKEMIRKFRHQLVTTLEAEPGEQVYQCNIQFFRLTEHPQTLKTKSAVNEGADVVQNEIENQIPVEMGSVRSSL